MLQGKIPSDVVSKRQQYLNSMKKFVEDQKAKMQDAMDKLGLQLHDLEEMEIKQVCPYNKNHVIPEKVFKKHTEKCRLLSAGFQKDELEAQLQNLDYAYEGKDSVVKIEIDEKLLNKIIWDSCVTNGQVYTGHRKVPVSYIDESVDLTADDRLAVYHHVVQKSHETGKVLAVDRNDHLLTTDWGSLVKKGLLDEQNNKEYGSKLEQLAALRDMKRRRQSYRAKNVHITKKSYTEIIREVIVNQMEILTPGGSRVKEESKSDLSLCDNHARKDHSEEDWSSLHGKTAGRDRRKDRRERRRSQSQEIRSRKSGARHESHSLSSNDKPGYNSDQLRRLDMAEDSNVDIVKTESENYSLPNDNRSSRDYHSVAGEHGFDTSTSNSKRPQKRSCSPSRSDSGDSRSSKAKKSKKSKHKKKHSKKHKHKD